MTKLSETAQSILSNGALGHVDPIELKKVDDHICGVVLKRTTRQFNGEAVPFYYLNLDSATSSGEPVADSHGGLLLNTKALRGLVEDFDPQVGDTIAVAVVGLTPGKAWPRLRYGVERGAKDPSWE